MALIALFPIEKAVTRRLGAETTLVPVFSPPGGYYDRDVQLRISAPESAEQNDIIFTLDGRVPTHAIGSAYTQPIQLDAAAQAVSVVRARAVLPDGKLGPVVSASYYLGVESELPMMSLIMEPDDLWHPEGGIYANALERGALWERPVDVTYVDQDRRFGFHITAGARIHGEQSRNYDKKSLRLDFRQAYGIAQLEYPLFAGSGDADSNMASFKRLVLHSGGQDHPVSTQGHWTLLRSRLINTLALQLGGYASQSRPVLLFINGEPWGIYHIRERIDSFFLSYRHNIWEADLLEAPDMSEQDDILAGDREHWDHLLQFVETHDLKDPANYAYVQSQVNLANLIDYSTLQIYAANTDWPHRNTRQFRPRVQGGRWHWMFWESDASFGANSGSRVDSNTMTQLQNDNIPATNGGNALLLRKLLENPTFRARFLSRTADLLNTTLAPTPVMNMIEMLAAELGPDIAHETRRWPSAVDWESNVEELRAFAQRRPDYVRQHVAESFGLGGTAKLDINPPIDGSGTVAINGLPLQNLPWHGVAFQDVPVQVTAVPAPGFRFSRWDPPQLPQQPAITLTVNTSQTIMPRFEPVEADTARPGDVVFFRHPLDARRNVGDNRFELLVQRPGGVDLRGWRVTDNDSKIATDEGSLIFTADPALAQVPQNTSILIIVSQPGDVGSSPDDLNAWDRRMVLYTDNGVLEINSDPGFNLGPNDNLVLLAPGPTETFGDDQGIDFVANTTAVTPASFGVLVDGVLPTP